LVAALEVEFPGGEDGDFFDGDDDFRNPEAGAAGLEEAVSKVCEIEVGEGGEEDEGFAFGFIGDAGDDDFAFAFGFESELFHDGFFDGFVGDHFAADFGEAFEAAFDVEEAIGVHAAEVAGFEPFFLEDVGGGFGSIEVTAEDIGTFEPDHAGFVEGEWFVGIGIGDAQGDAGEELADGADAS
jgi:hypothetical protein